MSKLLSVALFSLFTLATAIPAQITLPVSLSGRLEAAPADACDPTATHRIACTDVLLKSSSVDLATFSGRIVDMTGVLDALSPCTTIEVDSIAAATSYTTQTAIFGTRLGRTVAFTSVTPPGSLLVYLFGCDNGFLPLGPLGSLFLGLQDTVYVGTVLSVGFDLRLETIPNAPALVGAGIWTQFLMAGVTGGVEVKFLNVNCMTIQA